MYVTCQEVINKFLNFFINTIFCHENTISRRTITSTLLIPKN